MERGDIKEAIENLEQADEVVRHRIRLNLSLGESHACEEARDYIQKAITKLTPYEQEG